VLGVVGAAGGGDEAVTHMSEPLGNETEPSNNNERGIYIEMSIK